jgi:hypothetical protein
MVVCWRSRFVPWHSKRPIARRRPQPGQHHRQGLAQMMRVKVMAEVLQMTLFATELDHLIEELKALPVNELTPLVALIRLYELHRQTRRR